METDVTVSITLNTEAKAIKAINEIANWLEGNEPVPDHWDEEKRYETYVKIARALNGKSCRMLHTLLRE